MGDLSPMAQLSSRALALLDEARGECLESGREDLVERLDAVRSRIDDFRVRVVVVGLFKQGKSALVNTLVGENVCPVDDVVGTTVPTLVRHGSEVAATLYTDVEGVEELQRKSVEVTDLPRLVTEVYAGPDGVTPVRVEVTLPSPVLLDGLELVDTPGVGTMVPTYDASGLALLPSADAVLFVSDASQEYTEPERTFLRQAHGLCPRVLCVLSKTDPHPFWRDIEQADREHLASAGLELPLFPVSSAVHQNATRRGDAALAAESGIRELAAEVRVTVDDVYAQAAQAVVLEAVSVVEHLSLAVESELAAASGAGGGAVVTSLKQAEASAKALSKRSAKWQQTLNDGVTTLTSDVEYDLRDRLRKVGKEAELLIDDCDPGEAWEQIGHWLGESISRAVGDNFVWTHQKSEWLAVRVAEHFEIEHPVDLPALRLSDIEGVLNPIAGLDSIDTGRLALGQKLLIGMRNSYGGILMFGVLTSLAGLALINPISIAAGMVVGGVAYRHEAAQRLERRRSNAKVAVRRLIEESIFQIGKEQRDRLGTVRRTLRDHFADLADHMTRSLREAIAAATAPQTGDAGERRARLEALEQRQARLKALIDRAGVDRPSASVGAA